MLTVDTVIDWIQLYNTKNIGVKSFWTLLNLYGSAKTALQHVTTPFDRREAEMIYRKSNGNILITIDNRYPKKLKNYSLPPPILYYSGNLEVLNNNILSIIGARNASITGRNLAQKFANQLSSHYVITSGMARGIDTVALTSAIQNNYALAVLPFGLDNIYPHENKKLFDVICKNGLVITEVPPGRPPDQGMFLVRNKLIVMLSRGIVVIEAALKSGTMNTANLALDMGCEVMVVPGSPLDARSFGSNLLIKNGATLVQTAQDVFSVLEMIPVQPKDISWFNRNDNNHKEPKYENKNYSLVLTQLSSDPVSIDTLVYSTGIKIHDMLSILSHLELSGKVAKTANNEIVLI